MLRPPTPDFRKIPCPLSSKGVIRLTSGTAQYQCSRLRQVIAEFNVGDCDFTTHDESQIPVEPDERLVVVDFTPFARRNTP
ncbi:hypothetical protein [Streptomyces venezuelae]|uniref:hypothetical protein n=1 Tax=Streptomyces venezuelae TaxID=54571 RepID=UPI00341D828D